MKINEIKYRLFRNRYGMKNAVSAPNQVNIEYSHTKNLGDTLSPLIVNWMLDRRNIPHNKKVDKTRHLMAVGSVVGRGRFDVTLWGPGILKPRIQQVIKDQKSYRRYDIRAVRGPETRKYFLNAGYDCPQVYGDPAIIMPLIYPAESALAQGKKYKASIILHHRTQIVHDGTTDEEQFRFFIPRSMTDSGELHIIDPNTDDYHTFIDEIVSSEYVISASLHGIILAESYGIPAVFLNFGVQDQEIKFHDWYGSTGRKARFVKNIEDAVSCSHPNPPELSGMRDKLMEAFPYDLWD